MEIIKVTVNEELKKIIKARTEQLGLTYTDYFKALAKLDLNVQEYQNLTTCINISYNNIVELQKKLGMYCVPIQDVPLIKLSEECD